MSLQKWTEMIEKRGDRKYNAYYYSFEPTGDEDIDLLLASFALAGKLAHHTENWSDDRDWSEHYGAAPATQIQALANQLAAKRRGATDG